MTVAGARYVYNTILRFFATRPDKLFIVITAPPLSDRSNAANARAFNNWLVHDWLAENNYSQNNVAVFDFYNVLTGKDAHHTWQDGGIVHISGSKDTLAYPSGDDHPSEAGSRKATEEFLPLLNVFYHRWAESAPSAAPVDASQPAATARVVEAEPADIEPAIAGMLFDFEKAPASIEAFRDEATTSSMACRMSSDQAASGSASLQIDVDVVSNSWGTCRLAFDGQPDLGSADGLSFSIHAEKAGMPYGIILYAGDPANPQTYEDFASTPDDSLAGWAQVDIPWAEFTRVDWEEDAGTAFSPDKAVHALAFGFNGLDDGNNAGTIWVDDIGLAGRVAGAVSESEDQPPNTASDDGGLALPCTGGVVLPLTIIGMVMISTVRKRI